MSNIYRITLLFVLGMLVASCAAPATSTPRVTNTPPATDVLSPSVLPAPQISRHPEPMDFSKRKAYTELPKYDLNSQDPLQVDLRSKDLTKLDLSKSKDDLLHAVFDSQTKWPTPDKLPADFDWQKIMELGKDPGLGVRALHAQGVTGKGIGIAIIDQTLLVDHIEYKGRIRVYEETEDIQEAQEEAQMHGPAVTAIAVGKSVGVAPEADLYYIAKSPWGTVDSTLSSDAKAIRRIVEINKSLPVDRKIRVLSMSMGWMPQTEGVDEMMAAVEEAKAAGIFVITTSLEQTHGWMNLGLGRDPLSDPNDFRSYEPTPWLQKEFFVGKFRANTLLVPMDSRTTASMTGTEDYVFCRAGGLSWAVPYLAGMYALAAQVKPDITPEEFWKTALKTGRTNLAQYEEQNYEFGIVIDPRALIEAIKGK